MEKQQKTIMINTDIEKCYKTICDFETYPQWQDTIKNISVLERDTKNRPIIVEYDVKILVKKLNYTLRYEYDEEKHTLTWGYVGGDLKNIEGSYVFAKVNDQTTSATCNFEIELGLWVPKKIMNTLKNVSLVDSMNALKKRAENLQ
ncbi:SRPBCC family protein [Candidatus Uabimicrobium sp. HlEnr_7]|uniref:SRPBCC family protein n=1 Tax=Candidatus Uabimicrobium helgolandensis TaxID=3095367 RepID=UPI003558B5E7